MVFPHQVPSSQWNSSRLGLCTEVPFKNKLINGTGHGSSRVCFGILQTTSVHAGTSCLGLCTSPVASSGMNILSQQRKQPRCHEHPQQKQVFFWQATSE